jgi:hypothetical protein
MGKHVGGPFPTAKEAKQVCEKHHEQQQASKAA